MGTWTTVGWGLGGLVDGDLEDGWMVTGKHGRDLMPISGRYTDHGRLTSANQSWPSFKCNTCLTFGSLSRPTCIQHLSR